MSPAVKATTKAPVSETHSPAEADASAKTESRITVETTKRVERTVARITETKIKRG